MAAKHRHTGMTAYQKPTFWPLMVLALYGNSIGLAEETGNFQWQLNGSNSTYSVKQTGENYTFEFANNPGNLFNKLQASLAVLKTVYGDSSINSTYSETFMKETAQCFVFDANFYSYRACFLPNDYSPGNRDRFWGFVTQLPNAMWLITRNLVPALLGFGLFFYCFGKIEKH